MKRILHLGLGRFHRAHQAWYTQRVNEKEDGWRITAVSLRRPDAARALAEAGFRYHVAVRTENDYEITPIDCIDETLGPTDRESILARFASANTHVVTLTVTEKGYGRGPDGGLDIEDERVSHDLKHPEFPRSTLGWLVRGLEARRHNAPESGLTVAACDNLPNNGVMLERLVVTMAERLGYEELVAWLPERVSFPSSMVDRIVPAPTRDEIHAFGAHTEIDDPNVVFTEPFSEWVLERRFA
ncbi:MAG: mannitol dehydrogenase family protein, partial [Myxococcota bacterium]